MISSINPTEQRIRPIVKVLSSPWYDDRAARCFDSCSLFAPTQFRTIADFSHHTFTCCTLITSSNSSVITINGADACEVYWQVGSSATLGTETSFIGSIVASTSITLTTDASIVHGRAFALNGAVTMDSNIINAGPCIPTPGALFLLFPACLATAFSRRRSV